MSKEEELTAVWLQVGEGVGGEEEGEEAEEGREEGVGEDVASRSVSEQLRLR